MQLKALMKQHLAISDTVQRLIMNFSLQFLSTIIMAFIEITFNLYYYLVQVQEDVRNDQTKQVFDELFVTTVIYETVKIVLVVWACQSGKNQILEINTNVRDVYNSTSYKDVKYELQLFSLQLMHRDNIFSTKVLIVDATLLTMGSILGKMTLVYIEMLVLQMDMLYVNCVCVIKACFKQIDDGLVNLRELMINSEPYTLREINDEERNTVILMELKTLKKQHMAISDTVQMLNMIFTLQLLFTITKTFIFITFNLYFCLLRVQKSDSLNNPEKDIYYNTLIANVIFYVTKIMLIVWACETSKNQAMEISTTVIDISNSNNDKEIEYELELFSLQLMHRKNIFSAKGFTVNAKFLTTFQGFKDKRKGNIWQLFRATNFESLMYPCFTFCRILGVFPYKIRASTIKPCKPYYILSIIVICTFCVCELKNLYDLNFTNNFMLKGIPIKLERNCFYILSGFTTVITFLLSRPRMRLLQTILMVSLSLSKESYRNLSKLVHAKDIFGFFYIIVQVPIFYSNLPYDALHEIFLIYIYLLVFQMDMLYMNCVCILKACFKQINDSLAYLRIFMINDEPYLLRTTYHKQRNPFLLMQLKAQIKQHLAVSDIVQMLTTIFSLQLLSTIILTFIEITFNLYFYLVRLQEGAMSLNNLAKHVYNEIFITTFTYNIVKILLIVWACETGKNQALMINTTVHDIYNGISDREIKYELQLFAMQLMHRKNIFSAKVLIVDATLLTTMMGSVVTYLLILLQFLSMSNICNGVSLIP
ncbi:GR28B protein, partial [Acromyrmex heyeri]